MGALTFYITNKQIINVNTQGQLVTQINSLFGNPSITIDPATNNISIVTPYNIFFGKGIPLKILGVAGDRFLSTVDGTVYQKSPSEWVNIGQISYAAFITDSYFISPNSVSLQNNGTQAPTINNGLFYLLNNNPNPVVPVGVDSILYLKNNNLYIETSDSKLYVIPLLDLTQAPPVISPNPIQIENYNDFDTDKDFEMPITLNNQTNPSQSFAVSSTSTTNANIASLSAYNQVSPALPGPFAVEVFNSSNELMYMAFSNGSILVLDEPSSYVLIPLEKRIFKVPAGYININVTLGGSTAAGEMRVTVEALNA